MNKSEDYDVPAGHIPHAPSAEAMFVRRVLVAAAIIVLLLALWRVSLVLILIFGGVLVAVILRNLSEPLRRYLHVPDRISLLITTVALAIVAFAFFDFFGTLASEQFSSLVDQIPGAVEAARTWLNGTVSGREILSAMESSTDAAVRLFGALPIAGGVLGGIGEVILVLFVGIYFAADPPTYIAGVLRLVPPRRRTRARQILNAMGESLRKWLIGMTLDMLLLGVMTGLGMWMIGVPLPLALAVLSGVAVFVPYIGPFIAMVPGLLLALSVKPILALYALIVYLIVLTIEGNISQPLLQRWTVSLPPVMNLLAILVFSPLFGIWGAVLATPLTVALSVLVQKIYIEDVLDDRAR
ncbi:MAG: AI-2E family transporter [Alphaproteobacteria bacterium]|nr:AI-2E family transporter [Alphaproteobacteria bacterium]MDE2162297.1 AI-2E family transporter [Alphaproteobacteria bacterium]MDE2498881.1 AI-2E family transporter [Alphaproteobacteria bacterium]